MAATSGVNKFKRRLFRRGQTGQSLIILAIGFVALLGFVGIVTDVSLLFVRYSTLRRAVDAAAVAAAGQMRRMPVSADEITPAEFASAGVDPNDHAAVERFLQGREQATSIANLNLAARQFIEVYGLNPSQVLVETCYTQNLPMVQAGSSGIFRPADRNGVLLYNYQNLAVPTSPKTGPNSAANVEDRIHYEELCKDNEVKLVRVTAQIESPTVFLSLLGFPTITLTESSISQTAVLDVVLILDVSESMTYATTYDDWEEQGYYYRYMPPFVPQPDHEGWALLRDYSWVDIMNAVYPAGHPRAGQYIYREVPIDAGTNTVFSHEIQLIPEPDGTTREREQSGPTVRFLPDDVPSGVTPTATRAECTVRVSPNSVIRTGSEIPPWLLDEYNAKFGNSWVAERFRQFGAGRFFNGFVPMYRSYACCNDPNGDFNFSDLVCQPFQQVRDATDEFLNNLDFIRGDRVAFVTFDDTARILDPDGDGNQRLMIEIEEAISGETPTGLQGARQVLETMVGVRAVDSYYRDMNNDGTWDSLVDYDPTAYDPADPDAAWKGFGWDHFQNTATRDVFVQPTTGSCFLDNAILNAPQVPEEYFWRFTPGGDVRAQWPLLAEAISSPDWFWDAENADPTNPTHAAEYWGPPSESQPDLRSAEYRGGCGGGNIGGALNGAQQVFIEDGRTEGAVWLMVLLSDGAAGVTDPIARSIDDTSGDMDLEMPNVYNTVNVNGKDYHDPLPGDYGAFGACPYGTEAAWGEVLVDIKFFPYCSDRAPESRHFCSDMPMPPSLIELDAAYPDCEEKYDPDDYARDWADWVALANLQSAGRSGNEQLPTIFTIGIGMDYSPFNSAGIRICEDNQWDCRKTQDWSYEDYLGEQLLRYIADAGDNFQIDDDYWQAVLGERIPNTIENWMDKTDINWGPRGPCEVQSSEPNDRGLWAPLDPQQSCGNYFAAAEASDLERIFDIIASRMFTRLSQ